jgi:hypothetical protein
MDDFDVKDKRPSFWASLGLIASVLSSDLGRAVAVVGGLIVAFTALIRSGSAGANEWIFLLIAAGTFCSVALVCRK